MNKFLLIAMAMILSSCGNLVVIPRGCHSEGIYASKSDNLMSEKSFDYNIFFIDREVRLANIIDCKKIDLLKVKISKKFYFKYNLTLNYKEKLNPDFKEEK